MTLVGLVRGCSFRRGGFDICVEVVEGSTLGYCNCAKFRIGAILNPIKTLCRPGYQSVLCFFFVMMSYKVVVVVCVVSVDLCFLVCAFLCGECFACLYYQVV